MIQKALIGSRRASREFRPAQFTPALPVTQRLRFRAVVIGAISSLAIAATSGAQVSEPLRTTGVIYPTSDAADWLRLAQIAGVNDTAHLGSYLLRSSSTLGARPPKGSATSWITAPLIPTAQAVDNTALPFSMNDGALWAGRGLNLRVTGGLQGWHGRVHFVLAPELDFSANAKFERNIDPNRFFTPQVPIERYGDGYADPWYARPFSADVPWRFGNDALLQVRTGQSGAWYNTGPVEIGVTSENMWWGPGIMNAIVMSDNAAGVPRIELRTPGPWHTRAGDFEVRWFVGALSESQYFDTTKVDDVRSLAAAAVTWKPSFQPTLTLGVTRAVFATASDYGDVPLRWLDVFANTGHPADRALADSSLHPGGRDQLLSLFGRWIFPDDGFETYVEWARQELPRSLHDFIISPSQSHGYTLGLQYRKPAPLTESTFRVQTEVTTLEQSPTFKNRPVGVFYTSRRVIQGYTEGGQPIGAAIGPGASSQWIAVDRVGPNGSFGITFNRIRWNEDVHSTYSLPAFLGYCDHDVSILPGVRGGRTITGGYISGSVIVGDRLNAFFQNQSGCPNGPSKLDVHNSTLSISFTPFSR